MGNTFGDFAVACGDEPSRTMSQEESDQAHREMCQSVGLRIEALRREQRQAQQWTP